MTHEANFVFVTLPHAIVPFFNAEVENKQKSENTNTNFSTGTQKILS